MPYVLITFSAKIHFSTFREISLILESRFFDFLFFRGAALGAFLQVFAFSGFLRKSSTPSNDFRVFSCRFTFPIDPLDFDDFWGALFALFWSDFWICLCMDFQKYLFMFMRPFEISLSCLTGKELRRDREILACAKEFIHFSMMVLLISADAVF